MGYAPADIPGDQIEIEFGSDRGFSGKNKRTNITIGKAGNDGNADRPKTNRRASQEADRKVGNWDAADFVDAISPTTMISNGLSAGLASITGTDYTPYIDKFGFNPFGYAKDLSNMNLGGLAMRGLDAYATLGAPGLAK